MDKNPIPVMGSVGALTYTTMTTTAPSAFLNVQSHAPYRRFAVKVADDGLDSFGLAPGAYAIFREQGWPDNECQMCLIGAGDEATIRLMENIYSTEPTLRVSGDKIEPEERHRNDFIVLGVLDGVIAQNFVQLTSFEGDTVDWGC